MWLYIVDILFMKIRTSQKITNDSLCHKNRWQPTILACNIYGHELTCMFWGCPIAGYEFCFLGQNIVWYIEFLVTF